jgi:hypothetical protein
MLHVVISSPEGKPAPAGGGRQGPRFAQKGAFPLSFFIFFHFEYTDERGSGNCARGELDPLRVGSKGVPGGLSAAIARR